MKTQTLNREWITPPALQISEWDPERDEIKIEGISYSGMLFRAWGNNGLPEDALFRIVRRQEEPLTVGIEYEPRNRFSRAWKAFWRS